MGWWKASAWSAIRAWSAWHAMATQAYAPSERLEGITPEGVGRWPGWVATMSGIFLATRCLVSSQLLLSAHAPAASPGQCRCFESTFRLANGTCVPCQPNCAECLDAERCKR